MKDLVSVTTDDGIKLHGSWIAESAAEAESSGDSQVPIDVVLTVHGVGSNFYSGRMFPYLARRFNRLGVPVLCVNNRGRESVYSVVANQQPVRLGAAFETVADCCQDLSAWCRFLRTNGYSRIAVVGHSLGAIKAVFAQATQPLPAVTRLVAISSPRLTFEILSGGPNGKLFLEDYEYATACLEQGKPGQLFDSRVPVPLLISAATFVDKYGPANRYDLLAHLPHLEIPTLVVYGEKELSTFNGAFHGLPEAIRQLKTKAAVDVATVAAADHFYTDRLSQLAAVLEGWLRPAESQAPNDD